ncbi:GNAT family N-acetyltransferase [Micromonospora echinaurantiaca]|uniref:GNAT family N-acetyltransferase n=1 Tax=Micromonospora echinaurantiaca TaxID=47857 RepID=UPI003445C3D5
MADHGDPPRLEVRGLRPDERRLAGGLVARAMRDNPTTLAMCGADPFDRLAHMQPIWTAFFHRPPGPAVGAFHRGCLVGVAGATPPGACVGSTYGPRAAPVAGGPEPPPGDPGRADYVQATYAVNDLPEPHWHLGPVAVEPGFQGRGVGARLVRELTAVLDADGHDGWCETDTEANVRFYRALGWQAVRTVRVIGIPLWFLHRPGRRPAPAAPASAARRTDPDPATPGR